MSKDCHRAEDPAPPVYLPSGGVQFPRTPILCHACRVPLVAAYGLEWHGGSKWSLYHFQCPTCLLSIPVVPVDLEVPEWADKPKRHKGKKK